MQRTLNFPFLIGSAKVRGAFELAKVFSKFFEAFPFSARQTEKQAQKNGGQYPVWILPPVFQISFIPIGIT